MMFEHLNLIFYHVRGKYKQPFTFWYCVDNFYPWKDRGKKGVEDKVHCRTEGILRYFIVMKESQGWIFYAS